MKKLFYLFLTLITLIGCEKDNATTYSDFDLEYLSGLKFIYPEKGESRIVSFYTDAPWEIKISEAEIN